MKTGILKICTYPGCIMIGRWKPTVIVKSPDNDKIFMFDFQHCCTCDNHKNILTLDDIIGGKVFAQLIQMFKSKFIHPPKKEHCTLKWESVTIPTFVKGINIGEIPLIRNQ